MCQRCVKPSAAIRRSIGTVKLRRHYGQYGTVKKSSEPYLVAELTSLTLGDKVVSRFLAVLRFHLFRITQQVLYLTPEL